MLLPGESSNPHEIHDALLFGLSLQHFFVFYLTYTAICIVLVKINPQVSQSIPSNLFLSE